MREWDRLVIAGQRDSAEALLRRREATLDAEMLVFGVNEHWMRHGGRATRDAYRRFVSNDAGLTACVRAATDLTAPPIIDVESSERVMSRLRELRARPSAALCARMFLAVLGARSGHRDAPSPDLMAELEALADASVDSPVFPILLLQSQFRRSPGDTHRTCARFRPRIRMATAQITWESFCANALLVGGDTVRARAAQRALADAVQRDGRLGLRLILLEDSPWAVQQLMDPSLDPERIQLRSMLLADSLGDWWHRYARHAQLGRWRIDRGSPADAIPEFDIAIAALGARPMARERAQLFTWRGRAHSRAGNLDAALRDLRRAVALAVDSADTYDAAEAWHNLAHTYERAGRWAEAAAAIDRFAATTAPFRWDGLRVIARRDAADIKRKAGWYAAADVDARAMVAIVQDQDHNHQWAGEYLERRGELRAALDMYRRGVHSGRTIDPLDLAGMSRMYAALGRADSAAMFARRHDEMRNEWRPGEVPMLPDVLSANGQHAAAARLLGDWAAVKTRGADQHGAALALLAWGNSALRAGDVTTAERAAVSAESLSARAASPADAARARLLRARAVAARGDHARALPLAAGVADDRALRDVPAIRLEALLTTGEVTPESRAVERLSRYAEAANVVDLVSTALTEDVDRARYRARQLAPFDSALAISARAGNASAVARWAGRRKATALRLSVGVDRAATVPDLAALRERVGADAVLLDVSVLETETVLLVITRDSARVVRHRTGARTLDSLVTRLRRGMDAVAGGRVDVARIRVDSSALRTLSDLLLAPIGRELASHARLIIAADGPLLALPFEMLPMPHDATRALLDAMLARYVPGTWAVGSRAPTVRGTVLVVARDVPGAARELAAVRHAWSAGRVATLEGENATESAVAARQRGVGVLHVLAHAVADPVEPVASHLRLARSAVDDGFLHVGEVSAWRPAPALVVLSACATASGSSVRAEGPFSLTRAFLAAGSREVIATQWPVGAAAARMSEVLHRELARGASTEQALASARRALREDPATAHPFYWAPFILVANDAPR